MVLSIVLSVGLLMAQEHRLPLPILVQGNFTSDLTGLVASTPYYYKAYATNAGGTAYGAEQTFTTTSLNPTINTTALAAFGNVCTNTTAGPNSFTISGANLTTANVTVAALAGFTYSTTAGGTYTTTLSLTQPVELILNKYLYDLHPHWCSRIAVI